MSKYFNPPPEFKEVDVDKSKGGRDFRFSQKNILLFCVKSVQLNRTSHLLELIASFHNSAIKARENRFYVLVLPERALKSGIRGTRNFSKVKM